MLTTFGSGERPDRESGATPRSHQDNLCRHATRCVAASGPISVVVVDDHEILREGLSRLLSSSGHFVVTGNAADGAQAAVVCAAARPEVVLMDLSMPVLDGVAATRLILSRQPEIRIVVLTSFCDRRHVHDALAAGAVGYLLKDSDPGQLVAAVRSAAEGNMPLDPRVEAMLATSTSTTRSECR